MLLLYIGYEKKNIFIPSLNNAARHLGFNQEQAQILAKNTAEGGVAFLRETGASAVELRPLTKTE